MGRLQILRYLTEFLQEISLTPRARWSLEAFGFQLCFDFPKATWMPNVTQLVGRPGPCPQVHQASKSMSTQLATLVQAEVENLLCYVTFIYVTGIIYIYLTRITLEDGKIFITFTSFSSLILLVNMADRNPPICWCGSPKHPHIKGTWVPSGFARWVDLPLSEQLKVVLESRRIFPWAFTFSRSDYVTYLYESGQG